MEIFLPEDDDARWVAFARGVHDDDAAPEQPISKKLLGFITPVLNIVCDLNASDVVLDNIVPKGRTKKEGIEWTAVQPLVHTILLPAQAHGNDALLDLEFVDYFQDMQEFAEDLTDTVSQEVSKTAKGGEGGSRRVEDRVVGVRVSPRTDNAPVPDPGSSHACGPAKGSASSSGRSSKCSDSASSRRVGVPFSTTVPLSGTPSDVASQHFWNFRQRPSQLSFSQLSSPRHSLVIIESRRSFSNVSALSGDVAFRTPWGREQVAWISWCFWRGRALRMLTKTPWCTLGFPLTAEAAAARLESLKTEEKNALEKVKNANTAERLRKAEAHLKSVQLRLASGSYRCANICESCYCPLTPSVLGTRNWRRTEGPPWADAPACFTFLD